MPLLDKALSNVPGIKSITSQQVTAPSFVADDFAAGFIITEYAEGKKREEVGSEIILRGPFMPHQPFTFGGEQRMSKTWYPGNSEPTVNILGSQEDNLTIKGNFKLKSFKRITVDKKNDKGEKSQEELNVRSIALEYQELVDSMRRRGNLVQLVMGEWERWGFIEKCSFDLNSISEISYQIEFFISGFEKPLNTRLTSSKTDNTKKPNADLIKFSQEAIASMRKFPATMPRSISDFLNQEISKVASVISIATNAVNDTLNDVENINASANRAIGLIGNARATISQSLRRVNQLSTSIATIGSRFAEAADRTIATVKTVKHIGSLKAQYGDINIQLAAIQAQLAALRKTVPLRRHLIVQGDTLQKISNRYYSNPDQWSVIYDHNKLQSTVLTVGSIIEIPKV